MGIAVDGGCARPPDFILAAGAERLGGHHDRALDLYRLGYERFPRDEKLVKSYGGMLEVNGKAEAARGLFKQYLAGDPCASVFYFHVAGTYARQGQCDKTVDWLQKFLGRAARFPDIAGTIRKDERFARCEEAMSDLLDRLAEAERLRVKAWDARDAEHWGLAIQYLDAATEAAPEFTILLREAGEVFEATGDEERAVFLNEAFVTAMPICEEAEAARAANRKLRARIAEKRVGGGGEAAGE